MHRSDMRQIMVENVKWRAHLPHLERFTHYVLSAAERFLPAEAVRHYHYGVVYADNRTVKILNKEYRGKNKPTNVLSFENVPGKNGDMILALETLIAEARAKDWRLDQHLAHLLVHGRLHLAGMDHIEIREAMQMESLETRIMRKIHMPDPWKNVFSGVR